MQESPIMKFDEKVIQDMINLQNDRVLEFDLLLDGKSFPLKHVDIAKSSTPVSKPVKRGGVYFSDVYVYKIKGKIVDKTTIVPLLSGTMLGPNAEFADIELVGKKMVLNGKPSKVYLLANLTNSMESASFIELTLSIVGTKLEQS